MDTHEYHNLKCSLIKIDVVSIAGSNGLKMSQQLQYPLDLADHYLKACIAGKY